MRVAITGGTGFVGRHLARNLVRRETPRLCRGGSKSLTAPAVCFSFKWLRPSALLLGACAFDFGSR